MILVDSRVGSKELLSVILRVGVKAELAELSYGDFCFEGKGPEGRISIGIERKTLSDMLHCIEDSRYNSQRIGMRSMYQKSVLIVEGDWRPHDPDGFLMERFNENSKYGYCKYRTRPILYSKLYRYLLSVALSGVIITLSHSIYQTAFNICEMYHYFDKAWDQHTSLLETQKLAIPDLRDHPSLVRLWASDIGGIGVKHGLDAERLFKTPYKLAMSQESDWMRLKGIGAPTAMSVVRQIHGYKK